MCMSSGIETYASTKLFWERYEGLNEVWLRHLNIGGRDMTVVAATVCIIVDPMIMVRRLG